MNLSSTDVLTRIQNLLPGSITVFWAGDPLGNPEPAQFVVLEAGFDTPFYRWGQMRSNSKIDRVRVCTTTLRQRDDLIEAIREALPEVRYGINSVQRSTGKIGDAPNDRYEAVMNIHTTS